MVKLEEVLDEEFNREQAGPQVEDEWDTSDGTNTRDPPPPGAKLQGWTER